MTKIQKVGFYRGYGRTHRIMTSVSTFLDVNIIVAMIKRGLSIISVQSLVRDRLFHFQMSHSLLSTK